MIITLLRVVAVALVLTGCEQTQTTRGQLGTESGILAGEVPEGKSLLYFFRPVELFGGGGVYGIRVDGSDVGKTLVGTKFAYPVNPGSVTVDARTLPNIFNMGLQLALMARPSMNFVANEGMVHYIKLTSNKLVGGPQMEFASANIAISEVQELRPVGSQDAGSGKSALVIAVERLSGWGADITPAAGKRRFVIADVVDARQQSDRKIGERTAAFGVSMGGVYFDKPIPEFVEDFMVADLRAAGHEVVEDPSATALTITIEKFWFATNTTALYWDIEGEVVMSLSIADQVAAGRRMNDSFSCAGTERTYVWPGEDLFRTVIDRCLGALMQTVRQSDLWNIPITLMRRSPAQG